MNIKKIISCLLVAIAITNIQAAKLDTTLLARFVCQSKEDGYRVMVPGSCSQYFECQGGKSHLKTCPRFYDAIIQQCVNSNPGCVETLREVLSCEGPCCGISDGGYAVNAKNPAEYYLCKNNCVAEKKVCKNGQMFDLIKLECSSPSTCTDCTTAKPPCKPTTAKPPCKPTTAKPPCKPTTAKPPSKPTTAKPCTTTPCTTTPCTTTPCSTTPCTTTQCTTTPCTTTPCTTTPCTTTPCTTTPCTTTPCTTTPCTTTPCTTTPCTTTPCTTTPCITTPCTTTPCTTTPCTTTPCTTTPCTTTPCTTTPCTTKPCSTPTTKPCTTTPCTTTPCTTTPCSTPTTKPCTTTPCTTTPCTTTPCSTPTTKKPCTTTPCSTTTSCTTTTCKPTVANMNDNKKLVDVSHYVLPLKMTQEEGENYIRYSCINKPEGFLLPSLTKCNEYFICRNNVALRVSCGKKYFNVQNSICDLPRNTGCIQAK